MELKDLKSEYEKLARKYGLPSFEEIVLDFEIDKLEKDTEFLLRAIRKSMMEKIVNSINFLEMLLNPINTPRMYLPFIRTMSNEDRKFIDGIYGALADLTLLSLDLEIDSNDKAEAELIKKVFDEWKELKPNFKVIISNIKKPKNFVNKKERSYFG